MHSTATVGEALARLPKRSHGAVIVLDDEQHPVGVVTEPDCLGVDRYTQLAQVMSIELLTLPDTVTGQEAFDRLHEGRHRLAPVVDTTGRLRGLITRDGALRSTLYDPALDDSGRLRIAAAIGVGGDVGLKAEALLDAGIDVLVVDTAHGHQDRMLDALKVVRALDPTVPVVAGNVVTADGVNDLIAAGADVVKVGVGPGAMCTTRMRTGVGRPQFSAVVECAAQARRLGKHVWADGGVRHPRDVALAIAAGASNVMIGSWFAGLDHTAISTSTPRSAYKRASDGSAPAVRARTVEDPRSRGPESRFRGGHSRRGVLDPERTGGRTARRDRAGVRSACTYAGAATLPTCTSRVVGLKRGGYHEGRPLPVSW